MNDLTQLLGNAAHGDAHSLNQLYDQVYVGLNHQEIADALGVSEPTLRRHWAVARVRLFELVGLRSLSPETLDKP